MAGYDWTTIGPIAVGVALLVAASIPRSRLTSEPEPLPRLEYKFEEIGDYFAQRPVAVATRSAVVAYEGLKWAAGALLDLAWPELLPLFYHNHAISPVPDLGLGPMLELKNHCSPSNLKLIWCLSLVNLGAPSW